MTHKFDFVAPTLFALFMIGLIIFFYISGKKILSIFPPINSVNVVYRDNLASGYSTKSFFTWINRFPYILDIVVTDRELWIKTSLFYVSRLEYSDIIHKIPFDAIVGTQTKGKRIIIDFIGEEYEHKQVVIKVKDPDAFLQAIKSEPNTKKANF